MQAFENIEIFKEKQRCSQSSRLLQRLASLVSVILSVKENKDKS